VHANEWPQRAVHLHKRQQLRRKYALLAATVMWPGSRPKCESKLQISLQQTQSMLHYSASLGDRL
jgi:hypothetical protein